ncbi:phospholipase D-like domain-containing protein [Candidatus Tokpelaia sp.]|uniref:phospholipase D-like domain-containing protein n=1 Tax=Candidatus Tokpelaia sp. TaxID=2233777 RepID=UPI001239C36D|nr:phospholipase D-like domain-containing protein [Candidatus Tokpelaia sp.]KAA6406320.1 cardiolipin synthase [Candidatus Tokpelaia sp.]
MGFFDIMREYWPHILICLSVLLGVPAALHAVMTKDDVRSAIGWVGVIILSPILGAVIYDILGVNRIRRKNIDIRRERVNLAEHYHPDDYDIAATKIKEKFGNGWASMRRLGDKISPCRQAGGNAVTILRGGDEAYAAMLQALAAARHSILLESYIFDNDRMGEKFVQALAAARARGVAVRVLIDAVGARYSVPSIVHRLKKEGIIVDVFNGNIIMGLRLPYANLRSHRKILIIDGAHAFTGGMNIREGFCASLYGAKAFWDTHFHVQGPAVYDLFHAAAEDWAFAAKEKLDYTKDNGAWGLTAPRLKPAEGLVVRIVPSGPTDRLMENNQQMLIGAFSVAQKHILIKTPYLLPDRELISACVTAARRGVRVDIIIPEHNNLQLVDRAMRAQFYPLLRGGCHIWRATGAFDHSKLVAVDDIWAYAGSSNLDARSLRLNFEIDMEIMDKKFTANIAGLIRAELANAREVTMAEIKKAPFPVRLYNRIIWLASPYL